MNFWDSQPSLTIMQWILRAIVTFFWLFLLTKIMGQRNLGRLHAFDFAIAILVSGTATGFLNSARNSLISVFATTGSVALLSIGISYLCLKTNKFRRFIQGKPYILVENGKINEKEMGKSWFNIDDLMFELRQKNVPNLQDVEFAILETDGKLSVIPKSQARPIQPRDLRIQTGYEGMPIVLIEDGNVITDNLIKNNLDQAWLIGQLKNYKINNVSDVFLAVLSTNGQLLISKKN
jgi:uncharacterized membrane protein YcaP (DUF421 family)